MTKFSDHFEESLVDNTHSDEFLKEFKPTNDVILIIATAPSAFEDSKRFWNDIFDASEHKGCDVGMVNYAARIKELRGFFADGQITHFFAADSHTKTMQEVAKELPDATICHGVYTDAPQFDVSWRSQKLNWWSGSTSLFAIRASQLMGYCKIILAGCPMDTSGREVSLLKHYKKEESWTPDPTDHSVHLWKWREQACKPQYSLVRSMSGNTKRLLRGPTIEWLNQM